MKWIAFLFPLIIAAGCGRCEDGPCPTKTTRVEVAGYDSTEAGNVRLIRLKAFTSEKVDSFALRLTHHLAPKLFLYGEVPLTPGLDYLFLTRSDSVRFSRLKFYEFSCTGCESRKTGMYYELRSFQIRDSLVVGGGFRIAR